MKIGLLDIDGHGFPNYALMKIAHYWERIFVVKNTMIMKAIIITGVIILYILIGYITAAILYQCKDLSNEFEILSVVAFWPVVIYGIIVIFLFLYIPKKIIERIIRKK